MRYLTLCYVMLTILTACQSQELKWKKEFTSRNYYITGTNNAIATTDGIVAVINNTGWNSEFIPEEKPIVNTDSIDRIWVFKFDLDGNIKWKYLLDVCQGMDGGSKFTMAVQNNVILIHGRLEPSNGKTCTDFFPYILFALDKNGNELFKKRFAKKPNDILVRTSDVLVVDRDQQANHLTFLRLPHAQNATSDSLAVPARFWSGYYHTGVTSKDEVFFHCGGRVVKFTKDLEPIDTMQFEPDYGPDDLGFPNDNAKLKILDDSRLALYYSSYRSYSDKDSIGRYLKQVYIQFVDFKQKKFWFQSAGKLDQQEYPGEFIYAHDRIYISWLAYEHPARMKAITRHHLQCYTTDGKLQWEKSFPALLFFAGFKILPDDKSLDCFYLEPSPDYHKSQDEKIRHEKLSPDGQSVSNTLVNMDDDYYKSLNNIFRIGPNRFIFITNHPQRTAITRLDFLK